MWVHRANSATALLVKMGERKFPRRPMPTCVFFLFRWSSLRRRGTSSQIHTHTHIHRELCGSVRLTTLHLPCWLLVFCFVFMACVSTGNKCLHFLLRLDVFIASFSYFCRFYWCFGFICIVIGGFPDLVEYN